MELSKEALEDTGGLPGDSIQDITCSTLSKQDKEYLSAQTHPNLYHEQENQAPLKDRKRGQECSSVRLQLRNTYLLDQGCTILSGCWSPQGHQIAVGCVDGTAKVIREDNGQAIYKLGNSQGGYSCPAVKFGQRQEEDVNVIFMAQGSSICQYHVSTGQLMTCANEGENIILALEVGQNYQQLASSGEDGVVRVYDASCLKKTNSLERGDDKVTAGHNNHVYALLWHTSNPQILISSGWDETTLIWDLRANQSVRSMFGTLVCGGDALDLSSSQQELVTASWRKQYPLQLWDFGSGQLISNVYASNNEKLYAAKFVSTSKHQLILSGGQQIDDVQQTTLKIHSKFGELQGEIQTASVIHSIDLKQQSKKNSCAAVCCQDKVLTVDVDPV